MRARAELDGGWCKAYFPPGASIPFQLKRKLAKYGFKWAIDHYYTSVPAGKGAFARHVAEQVCEDFNNGKYRVMLGTYKQLTK
jgi:hypothetical protein